MGIKGGRCRGRRGRRRRRKIEKRQNENTMKKKADKNKK